MPALAVAETFAKRAVSTALTPDQTQVNTLIVAVVYFVVIAILWYVPSFSGRDQLTNSCLA